MKKLIYATSNPHKFTYAKERLSRHGIALTQINLDIIEIQSNSAMEIALHKAQTAYDLLQKPVIVNDANWSITALKGFPGPYMSPVEDWLTTEDFLRLMNGVKDREIVLTEILVFTDGSQTKVFSSSLHGVMLEEARGETDFKSLDPIVSFRSDILSLSQARKKGLAIGDKDFESWDEFGVWYGK